MNTNQLPVAAVAIVEAGIDGVFEAQVAILRAAGHWAERTEFNELGNFVATLSFVPVAGQKPERVFPAQPSCANVFSLQVRQHGGRVLMVVGNHVARSDAASGFVEPEELSTPQLHRWCDAFVAYAKLHSKD